jgi:hypothetical protein
MALRCVAMMMVALLAGCGPSWAPPNAPTRPCDIVSEAQATAAREAGAASGRADVRADGSVWLSTGPGVQHCASYSSTMRPCRRPNDYVIEYTQPNGENFFVLVPRNTEYRFNVHAAPNTCQIVLPLQAP